MKQQTVNKCMHHQHHHQHPHHHHHHHHHHHIHLIFIVNVYMYLFKRFDLLQKQTSLGIVRHASSTPHLTVESKDVNKNLILSHHTQLGQDARPMVLLFGWLLAKPHHLKKFTEFYLEQGFDVLSIKVCFNCHILNKLIF